MKRVKKYLVVPECNVRNRYDLLEQFQRVVGPGLIKESVVVNTGFSIVHGDYQYHIAWEEYEQATELADDSSYAAPI